MTRVVVTGFMATGKSTVGRELGRRYGLTVIDTDAEVEARAGRTVAEIFADEGEELFRARESAVFRDALTVDESVIVTGGGTLINDANRHQLPNDVDVVTLTCDSAELIRRVRADQERPLVARLDQEKVLEMLAARAIIYDQYRAVDTTHGTPEKVAGDVGRALNLARVGSLAMDHRRESIVLFEQGLSESDALVSMIPGDARDALMVCDTVVRDLGLAATVVRSLERKDVRVHVACLPAGEDHKNIESLAWLYERCAGHALDRSAVVIGVGGGVISDLAGMLAATYLRGLRLLLVPTTLVAQVDAALGGKTGVDLPAGKNLVGAFYPADLVAVDPSLLHSLPPRRVREGLAEIVKVGFVRSASLVQRLETWASTGETNVANDIIRHAIRQKLAVVGEDPFENGVRRLLNFGHTIGHALEAASGYNLPHGEAVAIGAISEARLAHRMGVCGSHVPLKLESMLERLGLPLSCPQIPGADAVRFMGQDKKRGGGSLRFAVPTDVGSGIVVDVAADDAAWAVREATRAA